MYVSIHVHVCQYALYVSMHVHVCQYARTRTLGRGRESKCVGMGTTESKGEEGNGIVEKRYLPLWSGPLPAQHRSSGNSTGMYSICFHGYNVHTCKC